ncbi:unnamed protein product, partial [Rotaria socialis]
KFYANHPNPLLSEPIGNVLQQIKIRRLVLQHLERKINDFLSV